MEPCDSDEWNLNSWTTQLSI